MAPLVVAAFTTTLAHPGRHAAEVVAAVVNNDEPVELEGQTVPLGRQLAAALAEGKGLGEGEVENYEWVMTNEDLAREGLDSGEYGAVVTIPPEFSAAATSTAEEDADPRQALIEVTTSPRARLVDDAVTHTIVRAAMGSVGNDLTGSYLENIFVGFNTLGEELGDAAEGAQSRAQGARDLAVVPANLPEAANSSPMGWKNSRRVPVNSPAGQVSSPTAPTSSWVGPENCPPVPPNSPVGSTNWRRAAGSFQEERASSPAG